MSFECGLCEVNLRQRKLIAECDEANCPYKRRTAQADTEAGKPLANMTYSEMLDYYDEDD